MARPRPARATWRRLLAGLLPAARDDRGRPYEPRPSWVDDELSRPRPDLMQSLGGRPE